MVEILDGPGAGATLMLRRAPRLLRVTVRKPQDALFDAPPDPERLEVDVAGRKVQVGTHRPDVDALDQPTDTPDADEAVYVYRRLGSAGRVHVLQRPIRGSGFYATGRYQHLPDVDGDQLRDRAAWEAWALANAWRAPGLPSPTTPKEPARA